MDPKTQRIDPGTPSDCDLLIERGHLALVAIASEARAARVEAQKAELEVALAEAQRGEPNRLRSWLENYRGMSESSQVEFPHVLKLHPTTSAYPTTSAHTAAHTEQTSQFAAPASATWPTTETAFVPTENVTQNSSELSWNLILPAARQRLQTRAADLGFVERSTAVASEAVTQSVLQSNTQDLQEDEYLEKHSFDQPEQSFDEPQFDEPQFDEPQFDEPQFDEPQLHDPEEPHEPEEQEPLVYQELPELQVLSEAERDLRKPFYRSGRRGLAFSVVVHSALIGTLMAITMRAPEEVASLSFEAGTSEGAVENLEELQSLEVTSTEEISPEMPSDASESSVSLPSAVGLSSTSVSAPSSTAASSMSGVQASANRAMAASSGRPNPAHANASFFGAAASGNCFCYVIDGSESMRGGPWEAAKAELLRSLSTMKESHRFYIIFFNQQLNAITMPGEREPATSPLYATAENLKHAQNWIESLRIERGAPPNDALLHAIELEPDAIYLLADGATKIDVPAFLRSKNRTSDFLSGEQVRVPIHAIAFYSPESGQKLMKQVATENKGQFIYVPDPRKR